MRPHTAAINELKAIIVTADEQLRAELRGPRTNKLVTRCSRFRDSAARPIDERCTRNAMRSLARRAQHLDVEIADHDTVLKQLLDDAAPQLIAERGVGYVTAAAFYVAGHTPAVATAKPPTRQGRQSRGSGRDGTLVGADPHRRLHHLVETVREMYCMRPVSASRPANTSSSQLCSPRLRIDPAYLAVCRQ